MTLATGRERSLAGSGDSNVPLKSAAMGSSQPGDHGVLQPEQKETMFELPAYVIKVSHHPVCQNMAPANSLNHKA